MQGPRLHAFFHACEKDRPGQSPDDKISHFIHFLIDMLHENSGERDGKNSVVRHAAPLKKSQESARRKRKGEKFMADKIFENNQVSIVGEIVSDFRFSHEVYGEGFYMVDVAVNRLSNYMDYIPLMISERLIDVTADYSGQNICVTGQFRSFNQHEEKKNRLVLSVFAREIEFLDEVQEDVRSNQIFLDGFICKMPVYRKTPLGREIADILLAVNRPYGKSDYIPCICWGRNARFASGFEVGGHTQIWGRIQSREYMKKIDEEESERRVAYEVSVSKLEYLD